MNLMLLNIAAAFGLGAAAGLNATLPLLVVGLLGRVGLLTLGSPFDALQSDVALVGLLVLAALEFFSDKIDGLDVALHTTIQPILAVVAGAIVAGAMSGAIQSIDPGVTILVGLLTGGATAGVVHAARAILRPATKVALVPAAPVSLVEDVSSVALAGTAVMAPVLVPVVLVGVVAFLAWGGSVFAKRIVGFVRRRP
ncbi:MAG: DUF4126 domain-containing protein [Chloroflexi bacterium]|nr:DUF4126 domain-containing protein [Chloroflexota bacterium]